MSGVAVIIVTWNASGLIGRVLEALERQTCRPERVLVIDNGSADATVTARLVAAYADVEWVPLPDNRGFAAANNDGIARCQEMEFVALLNPDAFPQPGWLAELVAAAGKHPEAAGFTSRLLSTEDPAVLDGAGDSLLITGKPRRRGHGLAAEGRYLGPETVFSASAAAALYRRQAVIEVRGFDEDYFCYLEDVDLGFRLRLHGHEARYVPQAVAAHMGSATTGGQHSDFSVYHGHRNLVWTFVKNMPGPLFWMLLPLHLLLNLAAILHFTLQGQGATIVRAKIDAIKGLSAAWGKRRQIQARRVASSRRIWTALDKRFWLRRP